EGGGMAVLSTGVVSVVAALTSGLPGMIATPLAAPTAILAVMAAQIAAQMAGEEGVFLTVSVAIALASFLTGSFLFSLGMFRGGDAIRFIPYPVVGGFMAGTGWLLVDGFFQVTSDQPLTWAALPALGAAWPYWSVGLLFTAILLGLSERFKHYLVMPGTLLALIVLFYGWLWVNEIPIETARGAGWLLGPFPAGGLWQPVGLGALGGVDWGAIAPQTGSMITVALVSLLSLVLSNSGIELVVGRDLNLNTELRSMGLASLIAGFGSGMVGNQALPSTLLVHNIGGHSRLTGAIAALPCLAVLALGSGFLAYFPKPVLGSLLLYLGLTLLYKWLIQSWAILPTMDYLTVVAMVVAINLFGFLQGIAVGFILSVLLFMYHYSHVDVAKEVLSGATTRSNVERSGAELAQLKAQGDRIFILELQGFLFFGTANYLLKQVKQRLGDGEPLQFIVLDFRQVTGVDASAVLSCRKIRTLAQQQQITLVFTNLAPVFRAQLEQGGAIPPQENYCSLDAGGSCQFFDDIDRGLEWCENLLLAANLGIEADFPTILMEKFLPPEQVATFCTYLEPVTLAAGERVYGYGEAVGDDGAMADRLYFVASGRVSVLLELPDGKTKRLQTVTQGNLLGEMRFYGKPPLSNAVVAEVETQLYGLSQARFQQMQQAHPALARQLEGYIVRILCDSLTRREQQLRVMR
ncbi:SulP family inorganic anion transporter, partial [Spirulina sp. CCNP1310]|uniref:SulP family inorganic anion transporter n=1 Tax=Spirulina sp. CCNP1310 TaxID=3110249 RepID=UPI002B21A205